MGTQWPLGTHWPLGTRALGDPWALGHTLALGDLGPWDLGPWARIFNMRVHTSIQYVGPYFFLIIENFLMFVCFSDASAGLVRFFKYHLKNP